MNLILTLCCLAAPLLLSFSDASVIVKRSPQMPQMPPLPGDMPMPPVPSRVARQASPPEGMPPGPPPSRVARQASPPEGTPPGPPPSRVARQAPPEGAPPGPPPSRVVRQLPQPPPMPNIPGAISSDLEMDNMNGAAAELFVRNRREAKGTVRLPTKTG